MDKNPGMELSQIARLLFNESANEWYSSLLLIMVIGLLGILLSSLPLSPDIKLIFAITSFVLFLISYYLRIKSDEKHDRAETMRRQAALSEGLGMAISKTQVSEWRRRAGCKVVEEAEENPREDEYYATREDVGPLRLLEMTIESAFYTRHLYSNISKIFGIALLITGIFAIITISILPISVFGNTLASKIAYTVYSVLPIVISIDIFFWYMRLERSVTNLLEIESDMEKLADGDDSSEAHVIRLISEYNCIVGNGIPIHNFLFKLWHKEINTLWNKRLKSQT